LRCPRLGYARSQKISVISRSLDTHLPSTAGAAAPTHRNLDPALHPFSQQREYTRAITAAKISRIFAKPFVGALEGHTDGVYTLGKDPRRTDVVAGGGGDGEVILHSLSARRPLVKIPNAHRGQVTGLCFSADNRGEERRLISCGRDATVKIWASPSTARTGAAYDDVSSFVGRSAMDDLPEDFDEPAAGPSGSNRPVDEREAFSSSALPLFTYSGKSPFASISHHRSQAQFATASSHVQIWDESRSAPLSTLRFAGTAENVSCVRFNQSEESVLASVGTDRTMCLYDVRTGKAERRIRMTVRPRLCLAVEVSGPVIADPASVLLRAAFQMKSNALSWNPTLPTVLLLASEDHNLYTFDIRQLATPTQIFKDHVAAVTSCEWSPTGEEFVSGGWDRSVRIWKRDEGRSRDVYHTKRMQRCVCMKGDSAASAGAALHVADRCRSRSSRTPG
jgi:WD repeat and SOF domain-containing protein 1